MRRVTETNIFLRNNNCTTALSTARCYFEATDDFPIFLSSRRLFLKIFTEIKREDIIQSLMTRKIVIFQEMSSMNVDYFRYLVLARNFLNFSDCAKFSSARNASWVTWAFYPTLKTVLKNILMLNIVYTGTTNQQTPK